MDLMVNPVITDFQQDVNGDIKMLKIGSNKEDAYANIIEQGGSAKLDNNKTATINVSTYTEPVVITPTSGKDGMKKATVTLSNIPSGSTTLYAWKDESYIIYTSSSTPTTSDTAYVPDREGIKLLEVEITAVGEGTITVDLYTDFYTYTRSQDGDISLT